MTTYPMVLGAGIGAGLWALAVWAWPPRPGLAAVLTRLDPTPPATSAHSVAPRRWPLRALAPLTRVLAAAGLPRRTVARDLAVLERPVSVHLAYQGAGAVTGVCLPTLGGTALALAGVPVGWMVPAWIAMASAALGLAIPDLRLRVAAARRRRDLRYVLSIYLDLVVAALAGGAGVDGALTDAASVGDGWAFARLRHVLDTARLTRTTSWDALGRLGADLAVPELTELAAAVSLAGTEGAKVRQSLTAHAATWRDHLLTDAEAAASAATERMSLPVVLLFAGFLLFVGYPAFATVLTDL